MGAGADIDVTGRAENHLRNSHKEAKWQANITQMRGEKLKREFVEGQKKKSEFIQRRMVEPKKTEDELKQEHRAYASWQRGLIWTNWWRKLEEVWHEERYFQKKYDESMSEFWELLDEILEGVILVIRNATVNCPQQEIAKQQVEVIRNAVFFEARGLTLQKIKQMANQPKTAASIARGIEIYKIMQEIRFILEPVDPQAINIFDGPVQLIEVPEAGRKTEEMYLKVKNTISKSTIKATL